MFPGFKFFLVTFSLMSWMIYHPICLQKSILFLWCFWRYSEPTNHLPSFTHLNFSFNSIYLSIHNAASPKCLSDVKWINKLNTVTIWNIIQPWERTTATTCNNMDDSQKHQVWQKKPDTSGHILNEYTYLKLKTSQTNLGWWLLLRELPYLEVDRQDLLGG